MHYVTYSDLYGLVMFTVASITLVFTILMYLHKK